MPEPHAGDLPHLVAPAPTYRPRAMDERDPRALHALRARWEGASLDGARSVLLGVPFDAAVIGRRGAREGPQGVREALRFSTSYHAGLDRDLLDARAVDAGDLDVVNTEDGIRTTHDRLTAAVQAIAAKGARPVVVGGDNSLSFAAVRGLGAALREARGADLRMGLVVVDAHHDLREAPPITSGTPYHRLLTELDGPLRGLVRPENLVEVGIRPFANSRHYTQLARKLGIAWHTSAEVRERGIAAVAEAALERCLDGADVLFLSVDIDGVDQSHAPGVSAPSPFGLHPEEVFHLAEEAALSRSFAGADVVETAPPLDPTGNTARVAAGVVLRCML